jgi:transcriptional regulator GlxA family with amidase domain
LLPIQGLFFMNMSMEIAVLIFDNVNALDVTGPCEVLSKMPNVSMKYVSKEIGPKPTSSGIKFIADYTLEQIQKPDILLVPGGFGTESVSDNGDVLEWIRQVHENTTWTASVCTGGLLLGLAGVLNGLKATTHWVRLPCLEDFGAKPQKKRVVIDGKVITSAGVSAGIDMALTLANLIAGETVAKAIQLALEYDPEPPFDAGSPDKAPKEIFELVVQKVGNRKK